MWTGFAAICTTGCTRAQSGASSRCAPEPASVRSSSRKRSSRALQKLRGREHKPPPPLACLSPSEEDAGAAGGIRATEASVASAPAWWWRATSSSASALTRQSSMSIVSSTWSGSPAQSTRPASRRLAITPRLQRECTTVKRGSPPTSTPAYSPSVGVPPSITSTAPHPSRVCPRSERTQRERSSGDCPALPRTTTTSCSVRGAGSQPPGRSSCGPSEWRSPGTWSRAVSRDCNSFGGGRRPRSVASRSSMCCPASCLRALLGCRKKHAGSPRR
mmetsp:Transcript_307/g.1009  ORF Transcript_307/g.1009 Transcript_307/m.1009 type:complete len:274 (-) Transcript_307:990-1811(-)